MAIVFEFWPEYRGGPLWAQGGVTVDLAGLALSDSLRDRVAVWSAQYADEKLPMSDHGDEAWLAEGRAVLAELRRELGSGYDVQVTEPWWDVSPAH